MLFTSSYEMSSIMLSFNSPELDSKGIGWEGMKRVLVVLG
jgi:hypothetical protein